MQNYNPVIVFFYYNPVTISITFLNSKKLGIIVLISHYVSNIVIGIIFRNLINIVIMLRSIIIAIKLASKTSKNSMRFLMPLDLKIILHKKKFIEVEIIKA